jgi:hypothetical protein
MFYRSIKTSLNSMILMVNNITCFEVVLHADHDTDGEQSPNLSCFVVVLHEDHDTVGEKSPNLSCFVVVLYTSIFGLVSGRSCSLVCIGSVSIRNKDCLSNPTIYLGKVRVQACITHDRTLPHNKQPIDQLIIGSTEKSTLKYLLLV